MSSLHLLRSALAVLIPAALLTCEGVIRANGGAADINTLASFSGSTGAGPNGEGPYAGLLLGADGNFYGTTHRGGTNGLPFGDGTVFKLTPGGLVTTLASFNNANGAQPYAGLAQGTDGNLYGTTLLGGTSNLGTIFRLTTNGSLTTLLSFASANGAKPSGRLKLGHDGFFYGTTQIGGTSNLGTVFRVTTNGILSTLISFNGTNGSKPYAELTQGIDGYLYGTTTFGGSSNVGTVFRLTTNGVLTTLFSFNGTNGANPYGGVLTYGGMLFGTTAYGGPSGAGTIFRVVLTNGAFVTFYSFSGGADGANPWATLLRGRDGICYGTTILGGGTAGPPRGTVFQITTNGIFTSLASFGFNASGASPYGGLVQDASGYLYGTTLSLGAGLKGTVFRLDPAPALLRSSLLGGQVIIGWEAWLGLQYQVQYKTNLIQNGWVDFGNALTATNGNISVSDSVSGPPRYYRLKRLTAP